MKNIFKKIFLLFVLLIAATFIASAQKSNSSKKVSVTKQQTAQPQAPAPAPAEKFFNVTSLDEKRSAVETASVKYHHETADKSKAETLHHEYRMAIRLYTVELERQLAAYNEESATGQKIRAELKRISSTD